MKLKQTAKSLAIISTLLSAAQVNAADLDITLVNLTHSISFTPVLVAAHGEDTSLFTLGEAASLSLQKMAEGGDTSGLKSDVTAVGGVNLDLTDAPTLAGVTSMGSIDTGSNEYLSLTAMLLPTNDGFVGLDSWHIPTEAGTYTIMLNGYDAGTEVNDEIVNGGGEVGVAGIPADPSGNAGSGGTGASFNEGNTTVHIHPGNIGDTDANGGFSDLDSTVHRWLNPVAKLVITVN
ncbi:MULTISPECIES: spondin domain-containing protein [unclassified Alteromonas]|uniref:spondin domain-containing protein n=1 Tax=unclassified Alteromonas TaxID=2614992 RepID=UPI001C097B97|nr:spondin domain-containing protein [Alteromonas sp. C1M14]MBU2979551.1 spondin domain-containing protein [Alteromonas sp. C1M14]